MAGVFLRYDGDTLTVDAEPWPGRTARTSVRVDRIDTPEIRSGCPAEKALALQAPDFLISVGSLISAGVLAGVGCPSEVGR